MTSDLATRHLIAKVIMPNASNSLRSTTLKVTKPAFKVQNTVYSVLYMSVIPSPSIGKGFKFKLLYIH